MRENNLTISNLTILQFNSDSGPSYAKSYGRAKPSFAKGCGRASKPEWRMDEILDALVLLAYQNDPVERGKLSNY